MKSICIFCGSSWGNNKIYEEAAISLSQEIASRGYKLVYGGASVGLMGACADAALAVGGEVIGILPDQLKRREIDHKGLSEIHFTGSMHERKSLMAELSDAFVSLPGGIGTMDELFEIWTWAMLDWHDKPSAVMNVNSYYDDLLRFLDRTVSDGFVKQPHRDMLIVEENAKVLLDRLQSYQPPRNVAKWIKK